MSEMQGGELEGRIRIVEDGGPGREWLKSVALYQKVILVCILFYLIAIFGSFFIPAVYRPLIGLGVLVVGVVAAVFVFMLALRLFGTALGIVLGILTLVPCVALIALLIVNGKATATLRANGVKVGLMGAEHSKI